MAQLKKILIIKPSALGDVINGLAVVTSLKNSFHDCEIHWLVNSEYADLINHSDGIDKIIEFKRNAWKNPRDFFSALYNFFNISRELFKNNYDIVIDLQGLLRSGWFTFITAAPLKIGFKDAREFAHLFYNKKVDVNRKNTHAVDCCLQTLKSLGCDNPTARWKWKNLSPLADDLLQKFNLNDNEFFIFVVGSRWKTKSWPEEHFARTAAILLKKTNLKIVLTGAKNESDIAENIRNLAINSGADENKIISLAGKISLPDLLALCKKSKLVLTTDTGPMHLAVAAGAKTLALMGPTSPKRHGPYNQQNMLIAIDNFRRLPNGTQINCAPCYKRKCPYGLNCMSEINPDEVADKILKFTN